MKKRSLVAALAMLIVSAVVLTSATYAWFAAGATATVAQISGTVSNSDGSVMVSGDNTNWKFAITANDMTTKSIASALTPVSITPSASDTKVMHGGFGVDGETWTGKAPVSTEYTYYKFYLKTTDGSTVTCNPVTGTSFDNNFVRALVIIDGTSYKVYGKANSADYTPIAYSASPTTVTGTDANHNWIMDAGEGVTLSTGGAVSIDTLQNFTISTTADVVQEIEVYLWAEGQHPTCNGTVNNESVVLGLTFTK